MRQVARIEREGRWVRRAVKAIFALTFALILAWALAVGFAAYKAAQMAQEADWSDGLRGVVERVWCGRKGCLERPQ